MGQVYLAKHPRLPRLDALKILRAALTADREFRERFNREADLAATLWHPHIVGVHDRSELSVASGSGGHALRCRRWQMFGTRSDGQWPPWCTDRGVGKSASSSP